MSKPHRFEGDHEIGGDSTVEGDEEVQGNQTVNGNLTLLGAIDDDFTTENEPKFHHRMFADDPPNIPSSGVGETTILRKAQYERDEFTTSDRGVIQGAGTNHDLAEQTMLSPDEDDHITIATRGITLRDLRLQNADVEAEGEFFELVECDLGDNTITIKDDHALIIGCYRGTVVFEEGTSDGVCIGNRRMDITDNGENEVIGNT